MVAADGADDSPGPHRRRKDAPLVTPPAPDQAQTIAPAAAKPAQAKPASGVLRIARRIALPAALLGLCGLIVLAVLAVTPAAAQTLTLDLGQGAGVTQRALQLIALITVLSLAPSILVMVTSFTRIVVVLSLLRAALGTQTAPPNAVIVGLALFLTAFVMAPVFQRAYDTGVQPLLAGQIEAQEAFNRGIVPFREFMLRHVREKDLQLFLDLSRQPPPATSADVGLNVLIPAFMISELRRAFEIGFMIFLPFLIIDLVVASILMSVGMMMLPPVTVALPFKLIFFVLVDGWSLIAGSLVQSYGT
jgi:flagellar biosynthetic protein FliP